MSAGKLHRVSPTHAVPRVGRDGVAVRNAHGELVMEVRVGGMPALPNKVGSHEVSHRVRYTRDGITERLKTKGVLRKQPFMRARALVPTIEGAALCEPRIVRPVCEHRCANCNAATFAPARPCPMCLVPAGKIA